MNQNVLYVCLAVVSILILGGILFYLFIWKESCFVEEELSSSHEPVFLHPHQLLVAKKNGVLNMKMFLPFFHYLYSDSESRTQRDHYENEDPWKAEKFMNILWTKSDLNVSDLKSSKFIPILLFGGIYHDFQEPLKDKYKKGIQEYFFPLSNSNDSPKELILLFRDENEKISDRVFASTYIPKFWKKIISETNGSMEEIYSRAQNDKNIDAILL